MRGKPGIPTDGRQRKPALRTCLAQSEAPDNSDRVQKWPPAQTIRLGLLRRELAINAETRGATESHRQDGDRPARLQGKPQRD